jgi:hypothetical protein
MSEVTSTSRTGDLGADPAKGAVLVAGYGAWEGWTTKEFSK